MKQVSVLAEGWNAGFVESEEREIVPRDSDPPGGDLFPVLQDHLGVRIQLRELLVEVGNWLVNTAAVGLQECLEIDVFFVQCVCPELGVCGPSDLRDLKNNTHPQIM